MPVRWWLRSCPVKSSRRTSIDTTGRETGMTYSGQVVDANTGTVVDDQPWLGWSTIFTAADQVQREFTPGGVGYWGTRLGNTATAPNVSYGYDRAGRLTTVKERITNGAVIGAETGCTTRTYSFDGNGNRTSQNSINPDSNGGCVTTGGTPTTRAYDAADRPTTGANGTGSYTYDPLGRQTLIPAADAPTPGDGTISLAYYDTDAAKSITQNGVTTAFTLDGAGRRLQQTSTGGTGTPTTLLRHYTDSGDNPTWSVDVTGTTTTSTRYNELIDGDLGLTLTTTTGTTTAQLALATPRGNTATTITLPTGATGPTGTAATGINTWTDYTEYGQPRQPATTTPGGTTPGGITGIGYGWLGANQRATLDTRLTLMGARLYNQATGLFTSVDPVYGGNSTGYAYPADPINRQDLDGRRGWWRRNYATVASVGATVGCLVPAVGWAACAGLQAGAFALRSHYRIRNHGWNRSTRRAIVRDGAWSAVTLGWGRGAGYLAKHGTVGRRLWNGRYGPRYSRSWSQFNGGVARRARSYRTYGRGRYRHAYSSAAISAPSVTYAYGRYGYGRRWYGR